MNPRQSRDFAKATGRLAKKDGFDAAVIAHFAQAIRPKAHELKDETGGELENTTRRRQQLIKMLVQEKTRLKSATKSTLPGIRGFTTWLEKDPEDINDRLQKLIGADKHFTEIYSSYLGLLLPQPCWPVCLNLVSLTKNKESGF